MAACAIQRRVRRPLVSELRRIAAAPLNQREAVFYPHFGGELRIKIIVRSRNVGSCWQQLMARVTIRRRGRKAAVSRVAREAYRVSARRSSERPLLQPESIVGQTFGWLRHELVIRIALRLIKLMADAAAFRVGLFAFAFDHLDVLVVREVDGELRHNDLPARRFIERFAEARKRIARGRAWAGTDMAVPTYRGLRAAEELLTMTADARSVFGILGNIGKRVIAFANISPVGRREFVTIAARLLVRLYRVRKF